MKATSIVEFVRDTYKTDEFIPLHAPTFRWKRKSVRNGND